jgi:hypothetical protein
MIYEYCERHGSGPFEKPFNTISNTISNIVFIRAAVEARNLAGRRRVRTPEMHLLIFRPSTGSPPARTYRNPLHGGHYLSVA